MHQRYKEILGNIKQFEQVIDCFESTLLPPLMYDSNMKHYGFRYGNASAKHFCTLKAVRAVSGLNAAINLAKSGFNQEVCVLIRTIIDCTAQIEFILAGFNNGELAPKQKKIIDAYFSDFRRNTPNDYAGATIRQEDVHKEIGNFLGDNEIDKELGKPQAKTLLSNVYQNFSNYIHARYPEVMDMYGGEPRRFHMNGMLGTRKDDESFEIIACFANSVSLTLALMIQKFNMHDNIKNIPELAHWIPY